MAEWGEIFANPVMQKLPPYPEVLALVPELRRRGVQRLLDAGCGAGRHALPLAADFFVLGLDREFGALRNCPLPPVGQAASLSLVQGDLQCIPVRDGAFDFVLSVNAITHGDRRAFAQYCRELDRVLRPGGLLYIWVSPREAGERMRGPKTLELEPGTFLHLATPDGDLVHHFPTREELLARFPGYEVLRLEVLFTPIPFLGNLVLPQLIFMGEKQRQDLQSRKKFRLRKEDV